MVFFNKIAHFVDPDLMVNRNILWATVAFGALALFLSMAGILAAFWLSYRERQERYRQEIVAKIDYLLKNLKASFNEIGESIFYQNNLELKRAVYSFDVYATLTLDELNPNYFAASHNKNQFKEYRKTMEEMTINSVPIAIERYNAMLKLNEHRLTLPETKHDPKTREKLKHHLADFSQKIEKKRRLSVILNKHPKEVWIYSQKELAEFRSVLESIWAHIIEAYKQYHHGPKSGKETNWKAMEQVYNEQEKIFYQFRGNLQSLFII